MEQILHEQLMYLPVISVNEPMVLDVSGGCMLNGLRPVPQSHLGSLRRLNFIACDSGGYQIYQAMRQGKRVLVGPMLRTNANHPQILTVGVMELCEEYRRIGASLALTVDFPITFADTDLVYYWKLAESRRARDLMLEAAPHACPDVELAIALQPRHPLEVDHYFCFISTPAVRTYAYPVRARNEPEAALGNAYVLSFLYHVGIKRVHFLGSSAPAVIFVLAQAGALGMFERITWDSLTWKRRAYAGFFYLNPYTLTPQAIHPSANLRTELAKYDGVFERTLGRFNPRKWVLAERWADIYNILAIEDFKDRLLCAALDGGLDRFVGQFAKYGRRKVDVLDAIRLLERSKIDGHDYIKRHWLNELLAYKHSAMTQSS